MIERKDFLALNFYKKEKFTGSYKNMHYRISKEDKVVGQEEKEGENGVELVDVKETIFMLKYWPGPYNYDNTADTLKQSAEFPFSEEGLVEIAAFLNEQYEKQKDLWKIDTMR